MSMIEPDSATESERVALYWHLTGRVQEAFRKSGSAAAAFRRAIDADPSRPEYYLSFASASRSMAENAAAAAAASEALRLSRAWERLRQLALSLNRVDPSVEEVDEVAVNLAILHKTFQADHWRHVREMLQTGRP